MTGKHHQWHKQWSFATTPGEVEHASGLRVLFAKSNDQMLSGEIGSLTWGSDGARWIGRLQGGDAALARWLQAQALLGLRDTASINNRLARLMREAGEWYVINVLECDK